MENILALCWQKEISHKICQKLINLGKGNWNRAETEGSQVKGSNYNLQDFRKSDIVWLTEQWVVDLVWSYMLRANEDAGWKYNLVGVERPQLTRYTKDGFVWWHMDGAGTHNEVQNDGNTRKLSMSIILNSNFEGGDFEMRDDSIKLPKLEEGSIIVFPSFLEHRITPVTKGIRYSLVVWFLGPPFK